MTCIYLQQCSHWIYPLHSKRKKRLVYHGLVSLSFQGEEGEEEIEEGVKEVEEWVEGLRVPLGV